MTTSTYQYPNETKEQLVERMLTEKVITFQQALLLMDKTQPVIPITVSYPSWATSSGSTITLKHKDDALSFRNPEPVRDPF